MVWIRRGASPHRSRGRATSVGHFTAPLVANVATGVALCSLLAALPAAQSSGGGVAIHYWNQDRANPAGDGFVDVEPVVSQPDVVWRSSPGELLADPVVWGSQVFCVVAKGRQATLVALDAATGEAMGRASLGRVADPRLAATEGTVVVCTTDWLRTYRVNGKTIRKRRSLKLGSVGALCLDGTKLFLRDERSMVHVVDVAGRDEGETIGTSAGRVAVRGREVCLFEVKERNGYLGENLYWRVLRRRGDASTYSPTKGAWGGRVRRPRASEGQHEPLCVAFGPAGDREAWYVRPPKPVLVKGGGGDADPAAIFSLAADHSLSDIVEDPVAYGQVILGFDARGSLIAQDTAAHHQTILAASKRPASARPGPLSRAGRVAYAGNFAVDLETSRVLWILDDVVSRGPLIPLADERILAVEESGALVCLGPRSLPEVADAAGADDAIAGDAGESPAVPAESDGVVLADGRFVPGESDAVEASAGGEEAGAEADRGAVVLDVRDGVATLRGEPYPVFLAFRRRMRADEAAYFEHRFEALLSQRLLEECRRILVEYQACGLPAEGHDAMLARLTGRRPNADATREKKLEKARREEEAERAQLGERFDRWGDWCGEHGLPLVATLIEGERREFSPRSESEGERVSAWIPETFPFRDDSDAAELWLRWAQELAPAGARFLGPEDPLAGSPWASESKERTLALRTRNLLLLSRSVDPVAVGLCLRRGEGAVRLLNGFFGVDGQSDGPLEVRLHADEEHYREELRARGDSSTEWSAGYYAPGLRASTFYAPDNTASAHGLLALRRTLTHELTHQFLSERIVSGDRARSREGIWAIEGIARFFEEQAVELGLDERHPDNPTVAAVDGSSLLLEQGKLLPLERLLRLDGPSFDRLGDRDLVKLDLRYTLAQASYTERGVFYDESGALVFYLLWKAGPTARAGLLDYLRAAYAGALDEDSWRLLGFDSIGALEEDFHAFLRTLAG